MRKLIRYIFTGKMHDGMRIMAREKCLMCNGNGELNRECIISEKIEMFTCSCIVLMEDYPINWFIEDIYRIWNGFIS